MPLASFQFDRLLAQASPINESDGQIVYELDRLARFDDPRIGWLLIAGFLAVLVLWVVRFYRHEKDALPRFFRWGLPALRLTAFVGIAIFFLNPQRRVDHQVVTDSQVLVLVDKSQSMSIEDESNTDTGKATRSKVVQGALAQSPLLESLREQHDVSLIAFDNQVHRLGSWKRKPADADQQPSKRHTAQEKPDEWQASLTPDGTETRLGDALRVVLDKSSGGPLAGVLVFSDGGQNSGQDPLEVAEIAEQENVPLYTIGLGSTKPQQNMRVQELIAPSHVYPGDATNVRVVIHADGYSGRSAEVQLYAREAESAGGFGELIGQEQIAFHEDHQQVPVSFQIEPAEVGTLLLDLRLVAPPDDQYSGDDRREVEVNVVEKQTRVMLIASAASRDYRFLRNQLRRDDHATVDVWLQSGLPGVSQDADLILNDFPDSKEELFGYDCIVAFDPDWTLLDAQQVEMLENWIAEEAGGLIVVAGPVHTSTWVQSPEHTKIRSLYPVEFQRRLTLLDDGVYGSKVPWPIEFTREGEDSDYLWLGESAQESRSLWEKFAGVFGCYAVKGPKPGARVLGRYSDPEAGLSVDRPIYLAEHFYGSGRVFYMGSGELWRLREMDLGHFETLYTKLIRHVSQGRLQRGSALGRLMVDRDRYSVGEDVAVRAQLDTLSHQPYEAQQVNARVIAPDGNGTTIALQADDHRPGNYLGQFKVSQEGSYRIELPIPDQLDEQLEKRIQVVVPDLEFDETRRNEKLLAAMANRSGGKYYTSLESALKGNDLLPPAAEAIASRAEVKTVRGTPDRAFTESLNRGLLALICGALCLEWFFRRLMKLA